MIDTGTMWLFFVLIGTVSGLSQYDNSYTHLAGAVAGFDPLHMNGLQQPNPGRRSQVFEYLSTPITVKQNRDTLNSFIDEARTTKCMPELIVKKIVNYNDYRQFALSSSHQVFTDTNCGAPFVRYENYASCDNDNSRQDRSMLHFFKDIGGELVLATTKCVTHTINIVPFDPTTFSQAFQSALVTIYSAAINPSREIHTQTFSEFVNFYGTHFSQRTHLGSRAIFGKLFATRATSLEEEKSRRRCVLEAAHEALTPGARWSNETTQMHFNRAASERCGENEENDVVVSVTGPLPKRSLEDWALTAEASPQPIFHELEPMSTLFKQQWFDVVHQQMQFNISGTFLHQFFKNQLSYYSNRMVSGGSNLSPPKGCGINSQCQLGTECFNDPDTELGYRCANAEATTVTSTPSTTTTTTTRSTTTAMPTTTMILPPALPTCGGLIDAVSDRANILTSHPGFGTSNYNNLVTLGYTLVAPTGYKVRIQFTAFNTESCCDHLYIHDGNRPSKTLIATLKGSPTLRPYTSTGTKMFLLFVTDHSSTSTGFSLQYQAVL